MNTTDMTLRADEPVRALGEMRVAGVGIADSRFITETMRRDAPEVGHGR